MNNEYKPTTVATVSREAHALRAKYLALPAWRRIVSALVVCGASVSNAYAQTINWQSGTMNAICSFKNSPLPAVIAAVAILTIAVLLILNEGKGLGSWVVRVIIGIAVIMAIGSIVTALVPGSTFNC